MEMIEQTCTLKSYSSTTQMNMDETSLSRTPSNGFGGLDTLLNKRDLMAYRPRTKQKIVAFSEELFQLKLKRTMLLRKESELDYILEDAILEEEYHCRCTELNQIISESDGDQVNESDKLKEERLFKEMMNIIQKRDQLLLDLDIERLRETEEDREVVEEFHRLKQVWNCLKLTSKQGTMSKSDDPQEQELKKTPEDTTCTVQKTTRINRTSPQKRTFGKFGCKIS